MTGAPSVAVGAGPDTPGSVGTRDAVLVGALALAARLATVAWAASRFPPTADGAYYHRIASRIAEGLGYTWLWPDGAVTYAAHYPVGYPAAVGALYALVGPRPAAAMVLNAVLGAAAAVAVHGLAARAGSRGRAALAGVLVALHPALVAYTPALMTEGVTAALLACAVWAAARACDARDRGASPWPAAIALGLTLGAATLVRPQSIVLAPVLGWLALGAAAPGLGSSGLRRLVGPALVTAVAIAVCAPWTVRNCTRMHRCALVSVNAGWNLLIGADEASTGAWSPVEVPDACREVWDEAEKDACFEREAHGWIARRPGAWLALAPRKLAATFDYCGAAGWYLHDANPAAFGERAKVVLGGLETIFERAVLLAALFWAALRDLTPRGSARVPRFLRLLVFAAGAASVFVVHAWVAYVALAVLALLRGRSLASGPLLASGATAVLVATAVTHAAFFGAGRYALVVFPLLTGLAAAGFGCGLRRERPPSGVWGVPSETAVWGVPTETADFDSRARDPAS